jgi:hypothetical protein
LCDLNRGNKWSFEPDANLFGNSKIMSRWSAAEVQVLSGDQTTGTADDEISNKEELEIAWHIASRKTSKSKFTKIQNRNLSLVEDASASCLEVEQFFAE